MKVLLAGYLGFGNVGDEAIAASVADRLRSAGHEVRLLSGRPAESQRTHNLKAYHRVWGVPAGLLWADTLVFGGGGLLQDKTSRRSLTYYLALLNWAARLGVQRVLFGQSVGPLSPAGVRASTRALAGAAVMVRDAASQARLAEMGVRAELGADAALGLPDVGGSEPAEGWLLVPRADVAGAQAALEALTRQLVQDRVPVFAMATEPGEDEAAVEALVGCGATGVPTGSVADARAAVARTQGVVSVRLHGMIFALGLDRAAVGVAYDPKVTAFASETGFPVVDVPVNAATLRAALKQAEPAPQAARAEIQGRLENGFVWLEQTIMRRSGG